MGHSHEHSHETIFGKAAEVPAVFSRSIPICLNKEMTGNELGLHLINWIEILKLWVLENRFYIGHIKVFGDGDDGVSLWLSTTGGGVNVKESPDWQGSRMTRCTIHITAIIFGVDEKTLLTITMDNLQSVLKI